ncbi:MAG: hypothetical protein RJA99_3228 [Pseudomonadota bacterium]|jgi:hypothetical protein
MGIRKWLRNWLTSDVPQGGAMASMDPPSQRDTTPTCRVSVLKAMNGRVLEVGIYKPNPRGPDWTFELFIVPENATIASAITTVFAMKALEN